MFEPAVVPDGTSYRTGGKGRPQVDHGPKTYDFREAPFSPGNTRGVKSRHVATELMNALTDVYDSETYLTGYVVVYDRGDGLGPIVLQKYPRISMESLPIIRPHRPSSRRSSS